MTDREALVERGPRIVSVWVHQLLGADKSAVNTAWETFGKLPIGGRSMSLSVKAEDPAGGLLPVEGWLALPHDLVWPTGKG